VTSTVFYYSSATTRHMDVIDVWKGIQLCQSLWQGIKRIWYITRSQWHVSWRKSTCRNYSEIIRLKSGFTGYHSKTKKRSLFYIQPHMWSFAHLKFTFPNIFTAFPSNF
jgi:hypothetical protein